MINIDKIRSNRYQSILLQSGALTDTNSEKNKNLQLFKSSLKYARRYGKEGDLIHASFELGKMVQAYNNMSGFDLNREFQEIRGLIRKIK